MTKGSAAFHHLHVRKRIHEKHEIYPHPHPLKRFVDKVIYFVGLIAALISIPQLLKIWVYQNAAGVSLITWSCYLVLELLWITYGFIHKVKPIIFAYCAIFVVDSLTVLGIILYR
jgi:uncharacterized protein with PQ loop repeat